MVQEHAIGWVPQGFVCDLNGQLSADWLLVSVMDVVMFEAQRQGRLSFYMVRKLHPYIYFLVINRFNHASRSPRAKRASRLDRLPH